MDVNPPAKTLTWKKSCRAILPQTVSTSSVLGNTLAQFSLVASDPVQSVAF